MGLTALAIEDVTFLLRDEEAGAEPVGFGHSAERAAVLAAVDPPPLDPGLAGRGSCGAVLDAEDPGAAGSPELLGQLRRPRSGEDLTDERVVRFLADSRRGSGVGLVTALGIAPLLLVIPPRSRPAPAGPGTGWPKTETVPGGALARALLGIDQRAVLRDADLLGRVIDTFVLAQVRPEIELLVPRPQLSSP